MVLIDIHTKSSGGEEKMTEIYYPTPDECHEWYEKMVKFPYAFEDPETVDSFTTDIINGVVVKADYGIYYLTNLWHSPYSAYGHCYFWDRRTKGRSHILREMLDDVMPKYKLHRVTVIIPIENRITARWLQESGFNLEGIWRAALVYQKSLHDGYQYAYYVPALREQIEFTPPVFHPRVVSEAPSQ